jgi:hypothetical protein
VETAAFAAGFGGGFVFDFPFGPSNPKGKFFLCLHRQPAAVRGALYCPLAARWGRWASASVR